jgi:Mrp family chromosome partitioning ATPase/uncharacterized protein involved in exopolysaccharide biosynthesis
MEPEAEAGPAQSTNPVLLVHRALRGRYMLALAIGAVLAVPGAIVGYKLMPPVYTSKGVIVVDPSRPVVLYQNEFNENITGFESFVRTQATTMQSPQVMQSAAQKLAEQGLLPPEPTNWITLQRATTVTVPRGSREVTLEVTMPDRQLAAAAAAAILSSYETTANEDAFGRWDNQELALDKIIAAARRDRDAALQESRKLAEAEDTVDLERRRVFVQGQIEALDEQIQALEIELPMLRTTAPQPEEGVEPRELTAEDYAQVDPDMGSLIDWRRSIEQQMSGLLTRVKEQHPDYLAKSDELDAVNARIAERKAELDELGLDTASGGLGFDGFRQRLDALLAIREARAAEARKLSSVALQIQDFEAKAQSAQNRLDLAIGKLEGLTTERDNATEGRIRIAQRAEVPYQPSKDRRKPLAAMGAAGGLGLSLGAFVLYGLLYPRYRYVADLEDESASPPVLGLVPWVEGGRIEADEAAQAGIHQIRSLLESTPHSGNARVIVVTSASAAEGKSTLAAALAASMARSGRHTLLIDADLIGRGVTSRLSARQLSGLSDRIASKHDNGQIHEVEGRENMDLMPAGIAEGFDADRLSRQAMEDLLASLRTRYEAIVIDTGPILGSLEANAVVPQADHVVLVVSRGQNARLVKVAIERLYRFHAGRIGLVFNRAARGDIERSTSAASISVRSRAYSRPEVEQNAAMSATA